MPQSMIQLPASVNIQTSGGVILSIKNQKISPLTTYKYGGLFGWALLIINYRDWVAMTENMEKHGLDYTTFIEECARELECNSNILARIITRESRECVDMSLSTEYSRTDKGRSAAGDIIKKIRECENWGDFKKEMHPKSRFRKNIRLRMMEEMEAFFREDLHWQGFIPK